MMIRIVAAFVLATAPVLAQEAEAPAEHTGFIAGTAPSARPPEAPVITEYTKDAAWFRTALHGVSQPYPDSLQFLQDQGAWWTPFIHAEAHRPYDIRGWHND